MEIQDIISSGLLELYVLGIATSEENEQVEKWMQQYPEISAEISSIGEAMESYAFMHAVEPPVSLKRSLLAQVQQNNSYTDTAGLPTAKVVSMSPYLKWVAAAAVILLIGSAIFNVVYFNKFQQADIARRDAQDQLIAQSNEKKDMENDMNLVRSKFSEPVALHGLEAAPEAAAKIFWMKNTGEVYVDPANLPEAPAGKQYQLWAIVDGKPVDAGMISPEKKAGKFRIQKMKSFGRAEAFAITLETAGGNPTPKGDMYVMGKI